MPRDEAVRVLGIDPGSRKTGWGVVEKRGNVLRCVAHGTATASGRLDLAHRIHSIVRHIEQVIEIGRASCRERV